MGNPLFDAMQWHNEQRLKKEDPTLYYAMQRKKNERLNKFLQLQSKNLKFEEIAKEIGLAPTTLRKF